MFNLFKRDKEQVVPAKKRQVRGFIGARPSAMAKFQTAFEKINAELREDYIAITLRARDLAKNNEMVNSYISLMIRNVLGANGFTFNATTYNDDGTPDRIANKIIEEQWYDYTKSFHKYVSADHQMNELEFDRHILFNFLVDGEVFIRRVKDVESKYGIRYEVLDALDVDTLYNVEYGKSPRVVMGIEIDDHYRPLAYWVRKNHSANYYLQGERIRVPASEIIHLYRKQYADQVRGYTPLASCIQSLAGLETYKRAEINASLLSSCYMGIWEAKDSDADAYSQYDEEQIDDSGDVATELETNVFRFAPKGFSLKNIQSTHPNSNVGAFLKAMIKGIASSLGVSSNKLNSDYESVNYSSLRQANMEDIQAWKELQQFLIDGWKNIQFAEWLKCLLLSDLTNLPFSKYEKFLVHDFRGRSWEYLDPQKEYAAIELKMKLKLTNPIMELERQGLDVDDVLDGWQLFEQKCKERGLHGVDLANLEIEKVIEPENFEEPVDDKQNNEE
jgi:lambda family phage portal protein